jgi:anti-sigma regulatory factor (Ser/Thr protein kinase)
MVERASRARPACAQRENPLFYVLSEQRSFVQDLPMSDLQTHLDVTLTPDLGAPERARNSIDDVGEQMDDEVLDDIKLLVNELVTNSVKFAGRGKIGLRLVTSDESVRVEVHDDGPGFAPSKPDPALSDTSGRGLFLVDALADRWGVTLDGTTCVWFEIDASSAA